MSISSFVLFQVGVVIVDHHLGRLGVRRSSRISPSDGCGSLDFTEAVNSGINQLFVSGIDSLKWIVPNGIVEGQTLTIRKTSEYNYSSDVTIQIKNQDLSSPNVRSNTFTMTPKMYSLSWCWDGVRWLLENVGQAA